MSEVSCSDSASICSRSKAAALGVALGQRAVQLAEQLAAAQPEDLIVQDLLASCHNNCGDALTQLQSPEAQRHFQTAVEIRERIDPARLPGVTLSLAESLINMGFRLVGGT